MWRWLPSVLCNKSFGCLSARRIFFLQLIGIVFGIHFVVFVLYGLIGWLQSGSDRFKISLTKSGATYVLMPLQKKVHQKNQNVSAGAKNSYKKSNVIDHETYERKKKSSKKSKATRAVKKSLVKNKSNKSVVKNLVQPKKQQASVMMQASKKQSVKIKKVISKKSVTKIQDELKVQPIVQETAQAEPKVLEQEMQPVTPVIEQVEEKIVEEPVQSSSEQDEQVDDDFDEDNVIFVGYEELDQSIIGSKIQHSIQQDWTPPVGMSKDMSCEVRVKVGKDGQALDAKVITTSGAFVYDASAQKTLLRIEYPKEVCNKSITILLGSS